MLVDVNCTGGEATRQDPVFNFTAKSAQSTWGARSRSYVRNPDPEISTEDNVTFALQKHLTGTQHATGFFQVGTQRSQCFYFLAVRSCCCCCCCCYCCCCCCCCFDVVVLVAFVVCFFCCCKLFLIVFLLFLCCCFCSSSCSLCFFLAHFLAVQQNFNRKFHITAGNRGIFFNKKLLQKEFPGYCNRRNFCTRFHFILFRTFCWTYQI